MITLLIILLVISNTFLSHLAATTAEKKEIGYNTVFWVSFLFSSLIGLLLSIASPNNPEKITNKWHDWHDKEIKQGIILLSLFLFLCYLVKLLGIL